LVESLARPGGNATGSNSLETEVTAKRLELLRELVPGATKVAALLDPTSAAFGAALRELETAAGIMGQRIRIFKVSSSAEINQAFTTIVGERPDALFVARAALFNSRRVQLAHLTSRHVIPATYSAREHVEAGGLMSYGSNQVDTYRQVGIYVGRILNGASPADLPVMQSNKLELVINAETARLLGLPLPPKLLAIADEVIE